MKYHEFLARLDTAFTSTPDGKRFFAYISKPDNTREALTTPITWRLAEYGIRSMESREAFYNWYFQATKDMVDRLKVQMQLDGGYYA